MGLDAILVGEKLPYKSRRIFALSSGELIRFPSTFRAATSVGFWLPLPSMALVKDQSLGRSVTELRLDRTRDHDLFFAWLMSFLFLASALHQAARFSGDRGASLQFLKATRASLMRFLHSSLHHGRHDSGLGFGNGLRLRKCRLLEMRISRVKIGKADTGSDIEENERSLRAFDRSEFQGPHFLSSRIHAGALLVDLVGVASSVKRTGRWSLPMNGPREAVVPRASREEERVKSIVEALPEDGLTLVPRSTGVMRHASWLVRRASATALPALLMVHPSSHRLWWPLKSPATTNRLSRLNKNWMSSKSQFPFGT